MDLLVAYTGQAIDLPRFGSVRNPPPRLFVPPRITRKHEWRTSTIPVIRTWLPVGHNMRAPLLLFVALLVVLKSGCRVVGAQLRLVSHHSVLLARATRGHVDSGTITNPHSHDGNANNSSSIHRTNVLKSLPSHVHHVHILFLEIKTVSRRPNLWLKHVLSISFFVSFFFEISSCRPHAYCSSYCCMKGAKTQRRAAPTHRGERTRETRLRLAQLCPISQAIDRSVSFFFLWRNFVSSAGMSVKATWVMVFFWP